MLWSAGHCEGQHRGLLGPRAEVHKQLCLASHFTFKGGCGFEAAGQVSRGLGSDRTNLIEDVRAKCGQPKRTPQHKQLPIDAMNLLACMMLPITVLLCLFVMTN